MKNKDKKIIGILVVTIIILVNLSACGRGNGDVNGNDEETGNAVSDALEVTELTAWAWDPLFNIAALELAELMWEEDGVSLNIMDSSQEDIVQRLTTQLASGITTELPNIVLIEDYRALGFLQAFPGMFYPIETYINPEYFVVYKNEATSFNGTQYGLPFDTGAAALYVRIDYLEAAGFTVDDVTNIDWDELIDIAIDVYETTGRHFLTIDPNDSGFMRIMLQTAGVWFTEEDGVTPFIADNVYIQTIFNILARIHNEGISIPATDWGGFLAGFNNGDVWALPSGNWITASVMAAEDQAGKWAVVPIPRLPGHATSVNASNLGGSSWYVLNIDGREKAARFLAETFGANVDFYQTLLTEVGAMGTFIPAFAGEAYQTEVEFFNGQRIFYDIANWATEIPSVNFGLHTYAIGDLLATSLQEFLNGQDLQSVLEAAQAQAESQLN